MNIVKITISGEAKRGKTSLANILSELLFKNGFVAEQDASVGADDVAGRNTDTGKALIANTALAFNLSKTKIVISEQQESPK